MSPYPEEEYYLGKSSWSTTAADWDQRFEVGDVVADPSGSWEPGTAEQYIDQQVATITGNLASETLARQTTDTSLQNQINAEVTTRYNADQQQSTRIDQLRILYENLTQSDIVVGTRPSSGQLPNVIYREPDQGHTPPQFYADYLWYNNGWVLMAQYDNAIDDVPTEESNNIVKSGGVASYLNIRTLKGRLDGNSWVFDYPLVQGKTYYFKFISGYGLAEEKKLVAGSSLLTPLIKDQWLTFTSPGSWNQCGIYHGGSAGEQPVVQFSTEDNVFLPRLLDLDSTSNINEIKGRWSGSGWIFDYNFVLGEKYYFKHVSGYGSGRNIAVGDYSVTPIITGKWIEITAPDNGTPYIYGGTGAASEQPIMRFAKEENITVQELNGLSDDVVHEITWNTINVSFDGTSKTGRTIHYSGRYAIANAINSITDASEYNRYIIHVEGNFNFTSPTELTMYDGNEYSAILMKKFVDIEGDGPDKSCVSVNFPANANFHSGKHYDDYQPIYFYGVGGTIRNMKITGKNCRYAFHIEAVTGNNDYEINIENCTIVSYGAPDYKSDGSMTCMGTGIGDGQVWNIKNCDILNYNGHAFAMHSPMVITKRSPIANLINCRIMGSMSFGNFQIENTTFLNIEGCSFTRGEVPIVYNDYRDGREISIHGDYSTILINSNLSKACFFTKGLHYHDGQGVGNVLKVTSLSTGTDSIVRFLPYNSTAYLDIIGDGNSTAKLNTVYGWDTQYGYVFRDGGVGLSGQAFGTIDVDENSESGHTLGTLLGDCSVTNKILRIQINNSQYTVTFNENYTNKNNDYVLGVINNVIGSVGTASIFCPTSLYYPSINNLSNVKSVDSGAILKGMGVVFVPGGMRKAKNSDGYIDGICLDDTSLGQFGRVITEGYIGSGEGFYKQWFYAMFTSGTGVDDGYKYGIDHNEDGKFTQNATPAVLRGRQTGLSGYGVVLEIL